MVEPVPIQLKVGGNADDDIARIRACREILEATDDWTKAELRKAYKSLIKVLHPDINGGDRSQEEQLQQVVWAWDQLKDSRNFK